MEVLKKTILQAVTTGITACTGTTGMCYVIIPDTGVTYYMKIGLKQVGHDMGFMDAYSEPPEPVPPEPPEPPAETFYLVDSASSPFVDNDNSNFIYE